MQALAIAQLDRALIHGMSILIRQRFIALEACTDEEEQAAIHESLILLAPLFDLAVRAQDANAADAILAEVDKATADVDVDAAVAAIDSVFLCP